MALHAWHALAGSFLTELLEDSDKADLEMLSNVHWNLGVSDFLFTDFADALLEAFRTWGSRGALGRTEQWGE